MQHQIYHIPALLNETIDGLDIKEDGTYVDVTFGGGGHSKEILNRLGRDGRLLSYDQDEDAIKNIIDDNRFTFVRGNFRFLRNFLRYHQIEEIDGLVADLGVSFHHFDEAERGFSFRFGGALDMRMNQRAKLKASDIVNGYNEEDLANLLYTYGEMRNSRRLAAAIVRQRTQKKITNATQLIETLKPLISPKQEKRELAQIFQALRIEVNDEMGTLREMLTQATNVLKPGGRLSILTYHSLEDRIVKNFIRSGNFEGKIESDIFGQSKTPLKAINNKVIVASDREVEENPRSRSAKLRIAVKK